MHLSKIKIIILSGGLGNQMFQYSTGLFIENKLKNIKVLYSILWFKNHKYHNKFELNKIFKLNIKQALYWQNLKIEGPYFVFFNQLKTMRNLEKRFFTKNLFFKPNKKCISYGCYSSYNKSLIEKYDYFTDFFLNPVEFKNNRKKLLKKFTFPKLKEGSKNLKISKKIHSVNSVSIHVRLGDYLDTNFHNLSKSNYYQLAIKQIKEKVNNPYIFIFSDDIEKCRELFKELSNCSFINWNTGKDSFRDMQLMSLCKHNIVANSTFSFWGAYLNNYQNRIIICPKTHVEYDQDWIHIPFNYPN